MASIQPGTGATFKSLTAEGRAVEALVFLQLQESNSVKNTTGRNAITGDFSIEELLFTGSYALPAEQTISSEGLLSIAASPYLTGVSFEVGTGTPTFKSTTIERYVLEVLQYIQILEGTSAKNPSNANNVTGTFNSDTNLYTGTFNLPVQVAIDGSGKAVFEAVEYLQS